MIIQDISTVWSNTEFAERLLLQLIKEHNVLNFSLVIDGVPYNQCNNLENSIALHMGGFLYQEEVKNFLEGQECFTVLKKINKMSDQKVVAFVALNIHMFNKNIKEKNR